MKREITNLQRTYPPANECIYCGSVEGRLTREHIIPHSLWGQQILPKSSCSACQIMTSKFEEIVARQTLGPMRAGLKAPSYNKPKKTIKVRSGKRQETVNVEDVVAHAVLPTLPISKIFALHKYSPEPIVYKTYVFTGTLENEPQSKKVKRFLVQDFKGDSFYRLLAKIAHGYVKAKFLEGWEPKFAKRPKRWLLPGIIDGSNPYRNHYIGGYVHQPPEDSNALHLLQMEATISNYISNPLGPFPRHERVEAAINVRIRLFAFLGSPKYCVTVALFTDFDNPMVELDNTFSRTRD